MNPINNDYSGKIEFRKKTSLGGKTTRKLEFRRQEALGRSNFEEKKRGKSWENSNSDVKKLWGDRSLRTRSGEIESRKIEVEDRSRGESLGTSSPGDRIFDKKVEEDREYSANEKEKRVYWSQSWSGLVV